MSPAPSSHQSHINSRKEKRMRKVDTFAPHNDGHQWRKYGEKKINNTNFPRYYYRCTYKDNMNCPATKQVQQKDHSDPPLYAVTYYNEHSCNSAFLPLSPSEFQLQTASGKAVSICFDSSAPQQDPPANAAGSPSSSSAATASKRPAGLQRSETYPWGAGAVDQKPASASCSTECHDAALAGGAVPEEVVDAGRFGSISSCAALCHQPTARHRTRPMDSASSTGAVMELVSALLRGAPPELRAGGAEARALMATLAAAVLGATLLVLWRMSAGKKGKNKDGAAAATAQVKARGGASKGAEEAAADGRKRAACGPRVRGARGGVGDGTHLSARGGDDDGPRLTNSNFYRSRD